MLQQLHLSNFQKIFEGNKHNYGRHSYAETVQGKKEKGKTWAVTEKLITQDNYKKHLEGKEGIGIYLLNEDSKCKFAVIDIDIYDKDLSIYTNAIEKNNFPIVPFRSKSGGLHLYTFFKTFISAKEAIKVMRAFASRLAIDILVKEVKNETVEVFPKQYKLEKGAVGSWINLPYFNYKDTKQYVIKNGKPLSIEDALVYIKYQTTTLEDAKDFIKDLPFADAPPCLQSLLFLNPLKENTGRNNYLLGFGTYLKKKDENFFEQGLFEINKTLKNPVETVELEGTVMKSLRKKDYSYRCKEKPLIDYCNKSICKKREYGVGKEGGYFSTLDYGQMFQIRTAQPYYEWEVKTQEQNEFKKLRFKNEDEIIRQDAFLKLCFRELNNLPIKMKQLEWFKLVNQYLVDIKKVDVEKEEDSSPMSLFNSIFYEFLLNRAMAQTKKQILMRRVYFDAPHKLYMFRAKDLNEYLFINKNFRYFSPVEVHGILKDMKATTKRIRTEDGKMIRVYIFLSENIDENVKLENSIEFKADFDIKEEEF